MNRKLSKVDIKAFLKDFGGKSKEQTKRLSSAEKQARLDRGLLKLVHDWKSGEKTLKKADLTMREIWK